MTAPVVERIAGARPSCTWIDCSEQATHLVADRSLCPDHAPELVAGSSLDDLWAEYHRLDRELARLRGARSDEECAAFDAAREDWIAVQRLIKAASQPPPDFNQYEPSTYLGRTFRLKGHANASFFGAGPWVLREGETGRSHAGGSCALTFVPAPGAFTYSPMVIVWPAEVPEMFHVEPN